MARVNLYAERPVTTPLSMKAASSKTIQAKLFDDTNTKVNLTGATVTFKMQNLGTSEFHIDTAATVDTAADGEVSYALTPIVTTFPGQYEIYFHVLDTSSNEVSYPGRGQWIVNITGTTDINLQTLMQDAIQAAAQISEATDIVTFTSSDSPITLDVTHMSKLIHIDSSGGAISLKLPNPDTDLSFKTGMSVKIVLVTAGNTVTLSAISPATLRIADTTMSTVDEVRNIYCDLTGTNFWRDSV